MQRTSIALALASLAAAAAFATAPAAAADGPWLVRVRAVNLDSANKDQTGLGLDLSVNDKVIPEVDISYFFTPNIAAELILTYPQKHDVKAGSAKIGSLKHLPPTLTLQYHFDGMGAFKPYVGAGVNYTRFSSVDLPAGVSVDKDSFGFAVQAGVDYEISKNVYLNLDIKKVQIRADISAGGAGGDLKVDPLLIGVGVGYRF